MWIKKYFDRDLVNSLPEKMSCRRLAVHLGVYPRTVELWVKAENREERLTSRKDMSNGRYIIRKDDVLDFMERTCRYEEYKLDPAPKTHVYKRPLGKLKKKAKKKKSSGSKSKSLRVELF